MLSDLYEINLRFFGKRPLVLPQKKNTRINFKAQTFSENKIKLCTFRIANLVRIVINLIFLLKYVGSSSLKNI